MILAWTGHRPERLGGYNPNPLQDRVRGAIHGVLVAVQPDLVITGMALGVDQWVAEACVRMGIPFVAAVPFPEQAGKWPLAAQQHWLKLIQLATRVHMVRSVYDADVYQERNEWMIENCHKLAAVWNTGTDGGTYHAVRYAQHMGREIIHVDPRKL